MNKNIISPVGDNWEDIEQRLFTTEEITESNARVSILSEFIKARNEMKLTQKQLETMSGIRQPMITRIEKGLTDPQLSTLLKILMPLGKTLAVVPLKHD